MKSRKILFIILAVVVLNCIASLVIGAIYIPPVQRAATYGVTDKTKSALVIHNNTSEFYVLYVDVKGEITHRFTGLISKGDTKAYILPPGVYSLTVHYSDRTDWSNMGFMEWYVDGVKLADFKVKKGRAAIFSLYGGDVQGMFYEPPELEDSSQKIFSEKN